MVDKYITIKTLGKNGRFGNQIFQYLTAKGLAYKYGVKLSVPGDWIGRKIFNIPEPDLDLQITARTPVDTLPVGAAFKTFHVIDLYGYYQYQRAFNLYSRHLTDWLKFRWDIEPYFAKVPKDCIVVHKRRGDYASPQYINKYCNITDKSYNQAIEQAKERVGDLRVITLTEENPLLFYHPDPDVAQLLPDFLCMAQAKVVIRANSTFSFWGGLLCELNGGEILSPVVEDKVGWQNVEFVWGNWPRMADSNNHPGSILTDLHIYDETQY